MIKISRYLIIVILFLCASQIAFGQDKKVVADGQVVLQKQKEPVDSSKITKIIVEHANSFQGINSEENGLIRYLKGDVRLIQDSTFMYCDTAILTNNQLTAYGQVTIIQNDSINVFSDSLVYDGDRKIATLFNEVVLASKSQELFTNYLIYDLENKIGAYTQGALLKNENSEIKSKVGRYYVNEEKVRFYENVTIVNEDFLLWADSLLYDSKNDVAHFLGPTRIDQDSAKIYCEAGFYDIGNELAEFRVNAQYTQGEKIALGDLISYDAKNKKVVLGGHATYTENERKARADTIIYFEDTEETILIGISEDASYEDDTRNVKGPKITYNAKTESFKSSGRSTIVDSTTILTANSTEFIKEIDMGVAYGDVILIDTSSQTTIESQAMFYKRGENYSKAYNPDGTKPLLYTLLEGDSLFMRADTLLSLEAPDSTTYIQAHRHVRIFKSDLQAQCDSMSFNTTDSILTMFQNPVIWSDSSQFTADTIEILLRNEQIYKVNLRNKGFIINTKDSIFFNQIKGKLVEVFFTEGKVDSMLVEGNAESIYFMLDEQDAYIGMNKSVCSKMSFDFENDELKDIFFLVNINSNLIPITEVNPEEKLEGFRWLDKERPKRKEEL